MQHWVAIPPPREKYLSPTGQDQVMLEDESGRLRLIGTPLQTNMLVTGCIIAVMGTENADGDFEIVELKVPDLPRQPQRWERDDAAAALTKGNTKAEKERKDGGKVAIVSGLGISGDEANSLSLDLLMEFLLGEAGGSVEQEEASRISRLIIAGNSLDESAPLPSSDDLSGKKAGKKYGYDSSAYNPAPTIHLDAFLSTLLPSIPITLLPGDSDPANVSLPQQPIHPALFPQSRAYSATPGSEIPGWFDSVTNPWEGDVDGWRLMGTGGQPVDDVYKYVDGDERLDMMESMLRWRCGAPTAPDTLCKYLVFLDFLDQVHLGQIANFGGIRVLSVPGKGPVCHRGMSTRLLCWQSAEVRDHCDRRTGRAEREVDSSAQIQGTGRGLTT